MKSDEVVNASLGFISIDQVAVHEYETYQQIRCLSIFQFAPFLP